jgi:hypothetical protein
LVCIAMTLKGYIEVHDLEAKISKYLVYKSILVYL